MAGADLNSWLLSEEAFRLAPLKNTVIVQRLQGPSYIYAVLMDKRIRQNDW